uniref:hypothetical protein n=1 Tax=Paractinoplanes polyasparticus TaxID=2856853 RepID=UPI001C84E763|nr:hypothetical protein [Actinoplanes polyasparticus]
MSEQTETIGTEPSELLEAMLAMIRRKGCNAERVTGYRERSYNIGYCETCSDLVADVRIYYVQPDGTDSHYQVQYTSLGELIRELTDDRGEQLSWDDAAVHEHPDERDDRWSVHDFDEEAR